jgi:NADH:ubiquinone reductase (H+-translocating)
MAAKRILVAGGGFAGLWSAIGAARKLDELGYGPDEVEVTLVNRDAFHGIRVRNYEPDLTPIRVPLPEVLDPVGIRYVEGELADVDLAGQVLTVQSVNGRQTLSYDRLVVALGSRLLCPSIPGLAENAFDVDTYQGAARLNSHLQELPGRPPADGRFTVVVVGAGLTGIEAAAEMPDRLRLLLAKANCAHPVRVILADRHPQVGSDMGESATPIIEEALASLGIETRLGIEVASISRSGVTLQSGEKIPAQTVVWCAGMRANPLTRLFPVEHDRFGRIPVDEFMQVQGLGRVFAAGDVAWTLMDDRHVSVMSCQHARPMGRFAGHNVVCDLFGLPMLPLRIDWYVTVLDLGPWGALYTQGWERHVVATGAAAKVTKQIINQERIYPPLTRNRAEILAAASPVVQQPPPEFFR